jgi:hypothetical protein
MQIGVVLLSGFLAIEAGCARSPAGPTTLAAVGSSTPEGLFRAVVVASDFRLTVADADAAQWLIPAARFSETGGRVGVTLKEVSFLTDVPGLPLTVILGGRITAGGSFAFPKGPEMRLQPGATMVRLTATFVDDNGFTGSTMAEAAVPAVRNSPVATLVISEFNVLGSKLPSGRLDYIPILSLAETGGLSAATITRVSFTLLNVGPGGNVPAWIGESRVPAGGTLELFRRVGNAYGDPDFEIDSLAGASSVSVLISFADDAGRLGSISAVAAVSR